jgi:prevent-host-death family protein
MQPITKTIGLHEFEDSVRSVLDEVAETHVPYVLTRDSHPEAVLVPYEEFQRFQEFQDKEVVRRFKDLLSRMAAQNAQFSDEEIAEDIAAARRERSR